MDKRLLFSVTRKDFEIQTFRAGGKGGQNQNKVESGVRIIHTASGARGEARDSRKQIQNKKAAFNRLVATNKFQNWLKREAARISGEDLKIQESVEKQMHPSNLRIEYGVQDNG